MRIRAVFPTTVWDGLSRSRLSLADDRGGDNFDLDRLIAEIVALQDYLHAEDVLYFVSGIPPADLGEDGHFAIDYTGLVLYGPKTLGDWGSGQLLGGEGGSAAVFSVNGKVGTVILTASDVGADAVGAAAAAQAASQPLDTDLTAVAALNSTGFARQAGAGSWAVVAETGTGNVVRAGSPALTGTPTAPTAAALANDTQIATTAFVNTALASVSASDIDVSRVWMGG